MIIEIAENIQAYTHGHLIKKIIRQLSKVCKGVIDFFQESTISTNEGQKFHFSLTYRYFEFFYQFF